MLRCVLAFVVVTTACACSSPREAPPQNRSASPAEASSTSSRVVGKAPKPNPGTAVIVTLEPEQPREFPPQTEKPVMDQVSLIFTPDLLFVRTGQPVAFRNSDDTLHNINVKEQDTKEQAFNIAIPTGESFDFTFKRDGFYQVRCDIHPAMAAEILSTSTPYATVGDQDGGFTLEDVAPGAYKLTVYTRGQKIERNVEVKAGQTAHIKELGN